MSVFRPKCRPLGHFSRFPSERCFDREEIINDFASTDSPTNGTFGTLVGSEEIPGRHLLGWCKFRVTIAITLFSKRFENFQICIIFAKRNNFFDIIVIEYFDSMPIKFHFSFHSSVQEINVEGAAGQCPFFHLLKSEVIEGRPHAPHEKPTNRPLTGASSPVMGSGHFGWGLGNLKLV